MKVGPRAAFKSSTQPKTLLAEIPGLWAPGLGQVTTLSGSHIRDTESWDPCAGFSFTVKLICAQVSAGWAAPSSGQRTAQQPSVGLGQHQKEAASLSLAGSPGSVERRPAGRPGGRPGLQHARAQVGMVSPPCFLQTRDAFVESTVSLPQAQATRKHHLLLRAQGELRTFISHSHICTFSINNVELK